MFGAGAPALCGPCELREKRARLIAEGWRDIPRGHRQAYLDCGIATEGTSDGVLWAPCWAASIVDVALGKKWLGAVLCRAAVDPQFRDAAVTVVSLTEPPDDPVAKLYTLAEGHGAV